MTVTTSQTPADIVASALETNGITPNDTLIARVIEKMTVTTIKDAAQFGLASFMIGDAVRSIVSDIATPPPTLHDKALALVDQRWPNANARDRARLHEAMLRKMENDATSNATSESKVLREIAAKDNATAHDVLAYANANAFDRMRSEDKRGHRENASGEIPADERPADFASWNPEKRLAHANKMTSPQIASLRREYAAALKNRAFVEAKGSAVDILAFDQRVSNLRQRLAMSGVKVDG